MDLKQLEYFISISQTLSFTRSANNFFLSQPAISRRISDLEAELGTKLFERDSHKVRLTDAGRAYLPYAASIVDAAEAGRLKTQSFSRQGSLFLNVSTIPSLQAQVVDLLSLFTSRYPEVRVSIDVITGLEQTATMEDAKYDIYFAFRQTVETNPNLDSYIIGQDRFCLYLPDSFAGEVDPEDFSTLQGRKLVVERRERGPFISSKIIELCSSRGLDVEGNIIDVSNPTSLSLLINAGAGFSINPESFGNGYYAGRISRYPISGDDAIIDNTVGWFRSSRNPSVHHFIDIVREVYPQ